MRNTVRHGMGILVVMWAGVAMGASLLVHGEGRGDHETIQAAIEAAQSGDQIAVAPGTYRETLNFRGKAIRLYSIAGAESTVIDGTGHTHVVQCVSGEGPDTIVEGFTMTGGNAEGYYDSCGGGLFSDASNPTVTHCTFLRNNARYGGAICGDATVTHCTFRENSARMGGAIHGVQTVADCTFLRNEESVFEAGVVTNCTFRETLGSAAVTNAELVTNCTFARNEYAGVLTRLDVHSVVTHCTFLNNGIGVTNIQNGVTTMTNCIVRSNLFGAVEGPALVTFSDIEGGWEGEGNIDSDPLFADPDGRLASGSPCIDTGTNDPLGGLPPTDLAGNRRPLDGNGDGQAVADMGAYEQPPDPARLLQDLTDAVAALGLRQRMHESLMSKLDAARKALENRNETNALAAAILLTAFIDTVQARQGKSIPQPDGDALIAAAQEILDLLADETR